MKKILSLFMAAIIAATTLSFSICAQAAEADCVTVTVTGTQMNAQAKAALDAVNAMRADNDIDALVPDKTLTAGAKRFAAAIDLHYDADFHLPDGSAVNTVFKKLDTTQAIFCKAVTSITADSIKELMTSDDLPLDRAVAAKSVGIGAFKNGSDCIVFIAISLDDASAVQTDFSNASYSVKEKLAASYIKSATINLADRKNGKYALSTKVKGTGLSTAYYNVNAGANYVSAKPAIFKIKGANGYVKKAGKVNVTVKTKSGKKIVTNEISCTSQTAKMYIQSVKSSKKKQMTVKWKKTVINASGYQLQYSTDKAFKKGVKTVNINGKNNAAKTIKKLKSKKTYYVRVRAFVNQGEGEKMYSLWSAKGKVRVK